MLNETYPRPWPTHISLPMAATPLPSEAEMLAWVMDRPWNNYEPPFEWQAQRILSRWRFELEEAIKCRAKMVQLSVGHFSWRTGLNLAEHLRTVVGSTYPLLRPTDVQLINVFEEDELFSRRVLECTLERFYEAQEVRDGVGGLGDGVGWVGRGTGWIGLGWDKPEGKK